MKFKINLYFCCLCSFYTHYISKFAAKMFGYSTISKEKIVLSLYVGRGNNVKNHMIYIKLIWETCIIVSDVILRYYTNKKFALKFQLEFHQVLFGADIIGKLFTGHLKQVQSGLVCIDTRLD